MNHFNLAAFREQIFIAGSENEFNKLAVLLFQYQSQNNPVYKEYIQLLGKDFSTIQHYSEIPFLPVTLFKTKVVADQSTSNDFYFSSSGTTGMIQSRHFVGDLSIYEESLLKCFELFYGHPSGYCFLALLPSYLERPGSSLVYMAETLMKKSGHPHNGFYLNNYADLSNKLNSIQSENIFLLGVTFALLDLFEKHPVRIPNAVIMETGGMKGRRKEIIRKELHDLLQERSGADKIHSEYGMTEMLSQAYSKGDGIFNSPPWLKIIFRDMYDPFGTVKKGETGIIHVIDLANIHSCSFIRTDDIGRSVDENSFEVLGRLDNSELRGCSLMLA